VRLSSLATSATNWPYQPRMIDNECGAVDGMRIGKGNKSTRRKPAPVPLRPLQIPHDLRSYPGRRCGKPATNRPNYGTVTSVHLLCKFIRVLNDYWSSVVLDVTSRWKWMRHKESTRIVAVKSERQTSLWRNTRFGVAGSVIWMLRKWRVKVWIRPNWFRRRSSVNDIFNVLGP
jgi:hypothetical protein